MDPLIYSPPRNGPTLWEIGIPDRSAGEFYVPDPYPTLMNKLYNEQRKDKLVQNPFATIAISVSLYNNSKYLILTGLDNMRCGNVILIYIQMMI